ncbi:hypothetical protein [Cohnella sp.]
MNEDQYTFASLRQDLVEEIQQAEQRLSEKLGHPITLIAYEVDSKDQVEE